MLQTFQKHIENIKKNITEIGNNLIGANSLILEALKDCDQQKFFDARNKIKNINAKTDEIDNSIIRVLALYAPEAKDLRQVVAYLKITNEFSRACSNTRSFIRGFISVCNEVDVKTITEYTLPMQMSTLRSLTTTVSMINLEDGDEIIELYEETLIEENKVDDLYEMIERDLVAEANNNNDFEKYHKMLRALRKSEKITGRATSIANLLVYVAKGGDFHK